MQVHAGYRAAAPQARTQLNRCRTAVRVERERIEHHLPQGLRHTLQPRRTEFFECTPRSEIGAGQWRDYGSGQRGIGDCGNAEDVSGVAGQESVLGQRVGETTRRK